MHPPTIRALPPAITGALLAAGIGTGCGGATRPAALPSPAAAVDECVLRAGNSTEAGEVQVAVTARTDSLLFARHRLATPIRLDCMGRRRPGLASGWTGDSGGLAWTLVLTDAGAVAERWQAQPRAAAALRFGGVESVVPLDEKRLVVTFRAPHDSLPDLFADPALGVAQDSMTAVVLRPMPFSGDARDAIDRGAGVIRTADPRALAYAAARDGLLTVPLPWDRTYALVLPARSSGLGPIVGTDTPGFRAALASGAVRVEARAAEPPFWWETDRCPPAAPQASGPARSSAVLHSRGDPVARALAERLVAIAERPNAVVRGVEPSELSTALSAGTDLGYVVALPRRALVPCREIAGWPPGATAVALVDTRDRLIVRHGVPPLEVEYDGAIRPVPFR
ncbi:MAG: hypothetical protein H0T68_02710 [Gemmatimonadales bacterium]|nr:hypothetical protein [Gemmatimonadales bacterium]